MKIEKLAGIDVGSNAIRLLVANVITEEDGTCPSFKKSALVRVPIRLGADSFIKGEISESNKLRMIKAMKAFKLLMSVHGVLKFYACATSAMREASNGKKIAKQIFQQTGVEIEIISGDEEAQLIFNSFDLLQLQKQQQFVVLDVGGGSTEISIFEHGQKVAARSFELGTIRILKGKIKADIWTDFEAWIRKNVRLDEAHVVFGTGGNINRALKMSDTSTNDTLQLTVLQKLHAALLPMSIEERCNQFKLKSSIVNTFNLPFCIISAFPFSKFSAISNLNG